ncbi:MULTISPECIES: type III secretion system cytoplasmic ring protein SctQ [unclassified Pseudomonas]|uniref:type III secretion system cytoplasmic ring protein SctQ n=1 Tax=unclassified Pseudomonas TaxID=196821 RepID=UPI0035C0CE84
MSASADTLGFSEALPWYDPAWQPSHRRLHRPRQPWHGRFGEHALQVQWQVSMAPGNEPLLVAWLALGESPLWLALPRQALGLLALPEDMVLASLASALLLEQALLPLIEPLEQGLGLTLQVLERPPETPSNLAPLQLELCVSLDGTPLPVQLRSDASGWAVLLDALDRHIAPAPLDLGALPLLLQVDAGEAGLTLAELRSLLPGDVVMLEPWAEAQVRLHLAGQLMLRAQRDGQRLRLLETPNVLAVVKEQPMSDVEVGADGLDSSLDELQLKLVCQVGSVELSFAQLRELGVGSVLELAPRMHDGVDLMINGRRVGQGQLVKVGDGLGVRVLSFAVS